LIDSWRLEWLLYNRNQLSRVFNPDDLLISQLKHGRCLLVDSVANHGLFWRSMAIMGLGVEPQWGPGFKAIVWGQDAKPPEAGNIAEY
jgi:hypothetical protein